MNRSHMTPCSDCKGQGYVELLLGGTEQCPYCEGTGKHRESVAMGSR
ncbi:YuiA family protein [Brevibacillus humidisoli]|nr:YuiA family protein [Brevibacillus humidisoli]UFJ39653.1 YuiA family protein [Brevibacillus humidisoli]